jgi:hypothetical protein
MDIVDDLIERIKNDPDVRRARFSNKFLNTVGEMCSRHGYGATRLFLMGRDEYEAKVLLKVLKMIEERNISIEIGTLIFKKLNAIKFEKR